MIIRKCSICGRQVIDYGIRIVGESDDNHFKYCPYCGGIISVEATPSNEASLSIDENGVLIKTNFRDGASIIIPDTVKAIGPFAFKPIRENYRYGEYKITDWTSDPTHIEHLFLSKSVTKISPIAFFGTRVDYLDVTSIEDFFSIKVEIITDDNREKQIRDFFSSKDCDGHSRAYYIKGGIDNILVNGKQLSTLVINKKIIDLFQNHHILSLKGFGIENIIIDEDVSFLPYGLLPYSMKSIIIKANHLHFGKTWSKGVFSSNSLESIDLSNCELTEYLFKGNWNIKTIKLHDRQDRIPVDCFCCCDKLSSINIDHIKYFDESSFSGCSNLRISSKDISNAIEIGDEAFSGCLFDDTLVLPPTLKKIGHHAFDTKFECLTISSDLDECFTSIKAHELFVREGVKSVISLDYKVDKLYLPASIESCLVGAANVFMTKQTFDNLEQKLFSFSDGATLYCDNKKVDSVHVKTKKYNLNKYNIDINDLYLDEGVEEIHNNESWIFCFYPKVIHIPFSLKKVNFRYNNREVKSFFEIEKIVFNGTKKEWKDRSEVYKNLPSAKIIHCLDGEINCS